MKKCSTYFLATMQWTAAAAEEVWETGQPPFGHGNPYRANTLWEGGHPNLRKNLKRDQVPAQISIRVYNYRNGPNQNEWIYSKVYINGEFVQDDQTRQCIPEKRVADIPLWPEAVVKLKPCENAIALEIIPGMGGRASGKQRAAMGKDLGRSYSLISSSCPWKSR